MSVLLLFVSLFLVLRVSAVVFPSQCQTGNFVSLNLGSGRRYTNDASEYYGNTEPNAVDCDQGLLTGGWYYFGGDSGWEYIINTPPADMNCGMKFYA